MARISGVDFYRGQLSGGTTAGPGLADMVERGVKFMIAKVGQATFYDSAWATHKSKMNNLGGVIQKGAYWFLEADTPRGEVPGYFYPPWPQGLTFQSLTYGGHSNYSVDWNHGSGFDDQGIAVLAAAAGEVTGTVGGGYGEVTIDHVGGYSTQYLHMRDITVSASDNVFRGQKIGEISNKHPTLSISPHLHHVHFRYGTRIKQKLLGIPISVSIADSDTSSFPTRYGQSITGRAKNADQPAYTGATQADMFLAGLNDAHDPTGWFCALDVEGAPTEEWGLSPNWAQVRQFADEFWRQAPGYPLFIYARKTYWNAYIKDSDGPIDGKAYGFAGLWTADWTQISSVYQSSFQDATEGLSFTGSSETPYAGGYAGFQKSRIIQYGPLKVTANGALRSLDGNAFDGTLAQLKAIATDEGDQGGDGMIPNLRDVVEATALTQLVAAGYVAGDRHEAYNLSVLAGRVIRTDPPSGTVAEAGTEVAYWVSLGPLTDTTVPYIIDEEEAVGLAALLAADLTAGTDTSATSTTIAEGRIISTAPVAGTVVAISSAVDYVLSLGPPSVTSGFDPEPPSPCG